MNFIRKKELVEEKIKYFTKKYIGIRLDLVTVVVVGIMLSVILTLLIFDLIEF
jgi:hypothetical protein